MKATARMKRDAKIIRLYEDGIGCPRIAEVVKLQPPRVRRILKSKGYDLGGSPSSTPHLNTIWERDKVDLRAAIANRARDAARAQLAAIALDRTSGFIHANNRFPHALEQTAEKPFTS
jgi:hypothetical protein